MVAPYTQIGKRDESREHAATATPMYCDMSMTYWLEKAEVEMRDFA